METFVNRHEKDIIGILHGFDRMRFLSEQRKCLHLYYYYLDREFGLMHVRLSTWVPFAIQVCLNGREYATDVMFKPQTGLRCPVPARD